VDQLTEAPSPLAKSQVAILATGLDTAPGTSLRLPYPQDSIRDWVDRRVASLATNGGRDRAEQALEKARARAPMLERRLRVADLILGRCLPTRRQRQFDLFVAHPRLLGEHFERSLEVGIRGRSE